MTKAPIHPAAGGGVNRNFLTVPQIAQRLSVDERTVQLWIASGKLQAEPLDAGRERSNWIVATAEVERFEKERAKPQ